MAWKTLYFFNRSLRLKPDLLRLTIKWKPNYESYKTSRVNLRSSWSLMNSSQLKRGHWRSIEIEICKRENWWNTWQPQWIILVFFHAFHTWIDSIHTNKNQPLRVPASACSCPDICRISSNSKVSPFSHGGTPSSHPSHSTMNYYWNNNLRWLGDPKWLKKAQELV